MTAILIVGALLIAAAALFALVVLADAYELGDLDDEDGGDE